MQSNNTPTKMPVPFANAGTKNTIPVDSQIGVTPGAASFTTGFPPLTFTPIAAGGVPPFGADFNGILNALSAAVRWANAGGGYLYDSAFASSIGGYPKGALLMKADLSGLWINTTEANSTNPDAGGAGWITFGSGGLISVKSLTGIGSYTPSPGTRNVHVRGWGAGGGGQASTTSAPGYGGGGGGYFEWYGPLSALGAGPTYAYAVGAAGTAGTTSGQNGGNGGDTTFAGDMTAGGGGGGGGGSSGYGEGGSASVSIDGALMINPGREGQGSVVSPVGGAGGNSFSGPGGVPHNTTGSAGIVGGGGAGGGNSGSTVRAGGAGGAGALLIMEYA